jgi:hypothetical protein
MLIPPETLYKYIRWSDKPRDKIKHILFKNRFYFADPTTFNDPFDSKIPIIFNEAYRASEKFHEDFLRIDNKLGKTNFTESEIKQLAKEYYLNPKRKIYDTEKMTQSIHKSIKEKIRISCFSTKRDNMLMWSHYADSHQGICIGFHTFYFLLDPSLVMLNKVNYVTRFPKFEKLESLPIVTTKSAVWKYENEYRLVNIDSQPLIEFPKHAIKEVIIGYRMSDDIKQKLLTYLKKNYPKVGVFFSRPNFTKFKMDITTT